MTTVLALVLACRIVGSAAQFDRGVLGNLKGVGSNVTGVMPTTLSKNFALVAEISLGTPPQKLNCLLDTGSSDLWVPSAMCRSCQTQNVFKSIASNTFRPKMPYSGQQLPREVSITYGSGQIVGFGVHDTLSFGAVEVKQQGFIIVEDAELPPAKAWDGICGLGWQGLAKMNSPLYVEMQKQGIPAIFAFVPGAVGGQPYLRVGEMAHEVQMEKDTLVWVDAEPMGASFGPQGGERGFWIVSGGLAITRQEPTAARFLVDTGTDQVLLAPARVYDAFMSSLLPPNTFDDLCGNDPRQGNLVVCDCSIAQEDLPPLRVYLGDQAFVLAIKDLFRRVHASDGSQLCLLQIQPNGMTQGGGVGIGDLLGALLGGLVGGQPGDSHGTNAGAGEGSAPTSGGQDLAGLLGALLSGGRRLQQYGQNPADELWIIGGVFLEHFVTIFDFDQARIGFAEPAGGVHALRPTGLSEVRPGSFGEEVAPLGGRSAGLMASTCVLLAALVGSAAVLTHTLQRRLRGAKAAEYSSELALQSDEQEA